MDKCSDPIDQASLISDQHNADCVARQARMAAPKRLPNALGHYERTDCALCGEDIYPPGRITLGFDTCIDCQTAEEKRSKR